ncbi:AAA family ATPase [Vibrio tubiashii]|uniref:AAA family ATPase n=1 Tax=Vibrio tubiashii TaxID=29498 RepID=UPI00234F907C|nr:AAA family ATPase [Vibrio tubiashii]WCP66939.1 AAA family ATPase [Vibrio tubiashii]
MSNSLTDIAQELKGKNKKLQLIYAFNGTGKTRLSREFKHLLAPQGEDNSEVGESDLAQKKFLYYNAFTEDLFYWDNDLAGNAELKLKIHPNSFTQWVLEEEGKESDVIDTFKHYSSSKITPQFNESFSEVNFSLALDDGVSIDNLKISKGEESNFIWSLFYTLFEQIISERNEPDPENRSTNKFDKLEYIFIDDPVSSLDENHLIELAIDLAKLIKSSEDQNLRFIITTHNPLFYNVLWNEFSRAPKYVLRKHEDGTYDLETQENDSPFSYHLLLKQELEKAYETGNIHKYHFNFLRNVLEKTSTFLGYKEWGELLPQNESEMGDNQKNPYARVINFYNHAKHSGEEIAEVQEQHKLVFKFLVEEVKKIYHVGR